MLTPSSNTVLEPVTAALTAGLPGVTVHFSRFRVTQIALSDRALGQFDEAPMLAAASLLADAKVDCITWNGTSAGWLGLETDRRLCSRIEAETGIKATSCVLTLVDLLRQRRQERIGLVTPYTDDVQDRIVANFKTEGIDCVSERHLSLSDNFNFALVERTQLDQMVSDVASAKPDAIVIFCTNLDGATPATIWEARLSIPIYDTIAVSLYGALRMTGADHTPLGRFGKLFSEHDRAE
jgi:maleate isomerase